MSFIRWLFRFEQMDGDGACPVYLRRWTLFSIPKLASLYLHHFLGDDWAIDPHDHPKRFISIGLKGWYDEEVYDDRGQMVDICRFEAPWIRTFPPQHVHRICASECGDTWTILLVLWKVREWGFIRSGQWFHWKEYVFGGISRKSCD